MSAFDSFIHAQYMSLKTFRKNGDAVPTPVWFAEENGKIYMLTMAHAGKVKRIRNNSHVEIAPCDVRGRLKENVAYIPAVARLLPAGDEAQQANQRLTRKYGLFKRLFDLAQRGKERVYIEISLA
ncbi:MAG: PPOX class F420-dependent oxidoreductase [bacterium]|nr:PPOX class F420-dependent oxidoreductase [bacterium]